MEVNKGKFTIRGMYYLKEKIKKPSHIHYAYDEATFQQILDESLKDDFDCVVPVEPTNVNERYHLQQSIFLCQCNPNKPLLKQLRFLGDVGEGALKKITIPASERKVALSDLIKMNINRASLFPGLDGYAKSLLLKYSTLMKFVENGSGIENSKLKLF